MTCTNRSEIILIAAMAGNRAIGKDNTIPWHITEELQRFKETTWGYPLIMGRKTYLSIGRPLPGRKNIVITRNRQFQAAGCEVAPSLDEAIAISSGFNKVFVIGGEQIFVHSMAIADTILLTVLPWEVEGDTFFPEIPDAFILDSVETNSDGEPYVVKKYRRKNCNH